jgi:hypothetical protein
MWKRIFLLLFHQSPYKNISMFVVSIEIDGFLLDDAKRQTTREEKETGNYFSPPLISVITTCGGLMRR